MFREQTKSSARQALICPINMWSHFFFIFFLGGWGWGIHITECQDDLPERDRLKFLILKKTLCQRECLIRAIKQITREVLLKTIVFLTRLETLYFISDLWNAAIADKNSF